MERAIRSNLKNIKENKKGKGLTTSPSNEHTSKYKNQTNKSKIETNNRLGKTLANNMVDTRLAFFSTQQGHQDTNGKTSKE